MSKELKAWLLSEQYNYIMKKTAKTRMVDMQNTFFFLSVCDATFNKSTLVVLKELLLMEGKVMQAASIKSSPSESLICSQTNLLFPRRNFKN